MLPTGYGLVEDPTVEVLEGKNNLLKLGVVVKTLLMAAVNQQSKSSNDSSILQCFCKTSIIVKLLSIC